MSLIQAIKKLFGIFGEPEAKVSSWTEELNRDAEDRISGKRDLKYRSRYAKNRPKQMKQSKQSLLQQKP